MTLERNMFGLHAPVRQMMERQLVQQANGNNLDIGGFRNCTNLGLDILRGVDEEIGPRDVLIGTKYSLSHISHLAKTDEELLSSYRSSRDESIG